MHYSKLFLSFFLSAALGLGGKCLAFFIPKAYYKCAFCSPLSLTLLLYMNQRNPGGDVSETLNSLTQQIQFHIKRKKKVCHITSSLWTDNALSRYYICPKLEPDFTALMANAMIPVSTYPELPPQSSFLIVPIMLTAGTRVSPIDQAVLSEARCSCWRASIEPQQSQRSPVLMR